MARRTTFAALCLLVAALTGCTTIGMHDREARTHIDFGRPETVALCVYTDRGISEPEAREMVAEAWGDEGRLYGLTVDVVKVVPWKRSGFTMDGIIEAITRQPLAAPCDRIMALVNRNAGDIAWGLLQLPEVLGAVNDETLTHGYTVARRASLNQLMTSPVAALRHEIYHMLGCDEHFNMDRCYRQIAMLKRYKQAHDGDFYPAWDLINQRIVATREDVNARLHLTSTASAAAETPAASARGN